MIEFVSVWRLKVDQDFYNTSFDDCMESPSFRTVHEGVGFDWAFMVYPNGSQSKDGTGDRDHLSFYLRYLGKLNCSTAEESSFLVVDGTKQEEIIEHGPLLYQELQEMSRWGYARFLRRTDQADFEANYCRDGYITFGMLIKIRESEFELERLYKEKRSNFPNLKVTFENMEKTSQFRGFDQVHMRRVVKPPPGKRERLEVPDADKWSILDFQILTKDDHVIFCHKFVLVMNNEKFSTLIGSGLQESQKSSVEVEYSSKTMMEVLHNIYRCSPSKDMEDLVLNEVIKAAEDYDLPELKLRCEQQLIQELKIENSAEFLEQAHLYNLTILKDVAMNLITENMEVVRMSQRGKESHINDAINCENFRSELT